MKTKAPILILIIALVLAGCSAFASEPTATPEPTETPLPPTETPTPTFTPTPTSTLTPTPTLTSTPTLTPTEAPCSHVDLNHQYQDFRQIGPIVYGYYMIVEQTGCEVYATETSFIRIQGPNYQSEPHTLTGTIEGDIVRMCYVGTGYCFNLVIFDGGDKLVNGVEHIQYEKRPGE